MNNETKNPSFSKLLILHKKFSDRMHCRNYRNIGKKNFYSFIINKGYPILNYTDMTKTLLIAGKIILDIQTEIQAHFSTF